MADLDPGLLEDLAWRGLVSDCTHPEELGRRLAAGPVTHVLLICYGLNLSTPFSSALIMANYVYTTGFFGPQGPGDAAFHSFGTRFQFNF